MTPTRVLKDQLRWRMNHSHGGSQIRPTIKREFMPINWGWPWGASCGKPASNTCYSLWSLITRSPSCSLRLMEHLTIESLSEDLTWYYRVKFADSTQLEQSGRLEAYLMERYPMEIRTVAFLCVLMCAEWLLKHQALLIRAKWLGEGWIGPALVDALCEKALAIPVYDVLDLIACSSDEIVGAARKRLGR